MRRKPGTGSITNHQGVFWARLPVDGKLVSVGSYPTYIQAEAALNLAMHERAKIPGAASATVVTFATFGRRVLDMREDEGVRSIGKERLRFAKHLETCAFADKAVQDVTAADIHDLARTLARKNADDTRRSRKLAKKTVQRCLALCRAIFKVAVVRELRSSNPCVGLDLKVGRKGSVDDDNEECWDWLRGGEQMKFLACEKIPAWFRAMVRFAWGTGLRMGEQWCLELRDVHFQQPIPYALGACACGSAECVKLAEHGPHVFVRWGSPGKPPKNGKTRMTPLFGEGLAGAMEWRELLPTYAPVNPLRLMFPTTTGCRRPTSHRPERSGPRVRGRNVTKIALLPEALTMAGVERTIRWHDLRHTCGSSLVTGTWGVVWSLDAVRDMLGHSSVTVTEKYAHGGHDRIRELGAQTKHNVRSVIPNVIPRKAPPGILNHSAVPRDGIEPPTRGFSIHTSPEEVREVVPADNVQITRAMEILRLVATGRGAEALAMAVTLADGLVESTTEQKEKTGCTSC